MDSLLQLNCTNLRKTFWSAKFWLPANNDWNSFPCPSPYDFVYSLIIAVFMSFIRFFLNRFVFIPLGLRHGLTMVRMRKVQSIPYLETNYRIQKRPSDNEMMAFSKKLDISFAKVSAWFRGKRNSEKVPTLFKFSESAWKFTFHSSLFIYGVISLLQEPFLYDTALYYINYPNHQMTNFIFWYYMVELGNYVALCLWVFFEVKRNDFYVMLIHHVSTCSLIIFSYMTRYFRIGSVILLLHDSADVWLELSKMLRYVGLTSPCMICFAIFFAVWIITRLYWFPFKVIASIFFKAPGIIGQFPAMMLFSCFLLILQGLHIFWTILIIRTAVKPIITGRPAEDARSDSEMSEIEFNEHPKVYSNRNGAVQVQPIGNAHNSISERETCKSVKVESNGTGGLKSNGIH